MDAFPPERLSPLLNLASSSTDIREVVQLSIEDSCSARSEPAASRSSMSIGANCPLVERQADLTNHGDVLRLGALHPGALLCCNLLEHVTEPDRLAYHCLELLMPGGLVFVTVPFSYPYHRDPIDTIVSAEPFRVGESYRDVVRERP